MISTLSIILIISVLAATPIIMFDVVQEDSKIEEYWINKDKENKKKDEISKDDMKKAAVGGAGLYGLSKVLSKEKTYFIGFFIITWKYLGGGFFNFFLTIPISIFFYLYRKFTGA